MKIYHQLIKNIFTVLAIILLFFPELPSAQASEITEGVKKTLDSIIVIVSREDLKNNEKKAERRVLLREVISKKFS
ncbi:MAG: hypothetical protein QGG95_00630, partial [Nitrospinota bacterium]|nr:hypothetical protein [Nitrospinota bacterium]